MRFLPAIPATVFIFFCALWAKAIYPQASGLGDPDFFWHLATGQWMIDHGAIPTVDQFSWTVPGEPYRITQWLGEYLMAAAFNVGGLYATKAFSVALAGLTIWLGWRAAMLYMRNSMLALWLSLLCNLVNLVTPLRPQLFSFVGAAAIAYLFAAWLKHRDWRWLAPIPFLMALWTNLHGGFVVGVLFLGLAFLCQYAESVRLQGMVSRRRQLIELGVVGVLSILATLANPYGLGAWESVLLVSGLQSSSVIEEWKAVQITTELGWFLMFIAIPFLMSMIYGTRHLTQVVLGICFLFFAASANRQVPIAGALMPFIVASMLEESRKLALMQHGAKNPSFRLTFYIPLLTMVLIFPLLQAKGDKSWATTMDGQFPESAMAFLRSHNLSERVLSDIDDGNYLMFHGFKVSLDSRMDYYGDRFFFDWYLASRGAPGWDAFMEKAAPETVLLRKEVALRQLLLEGTDWKQVYEDNRYSILVPAIKLSAMLPEMKPAQVNYLNDKGRLIRPYRP